MIIVNCPSYRHSYDDDGDDAQKREGIETVESCHGCPAIYRTDDAQFVEKDLSLPSTLLKMGPMLGLMGTLIPMGPALVGLSTGDIASMAYNMQVAFATTVVGLFSAAIGFVTKQTKNRWYAEDMSNLEFIAELLEEK